MKKAWIILIALWKIIVWFFNKSAVRNAQRKILQKEVADAIKNDDTRSLHRIMSRL